MSNALSVTDDQSMRSIDPKPQIFSTYFILRIFDAIIEPISGLALAQKTAVPNKFSPFECKRSTETFHTGTKQNIENTGIEAKRVSPKLYQSWNISSFLNLFCGTRWFVISFCFCRLLIWGVSYIIYIFFWTAPYATAGVAESKVRYFFRLGYYFLFPLLLYYEEDANTKGKTRSKKKRAIV